MLALWGCGGEQEKLRKSAEDEYGGTPAHLVPEDEKTLISFAKALPLYYKAIGATMPHDTLESYKTATNSAMVDNHYALLYNSVRLLLPPISRAIHLSDARIGKIVPIPAIHSLVTAVREFTHFVRTNRKLYSWRGSSALRECINLINTKSHKRDAFDASFAFNALYRSLGRYFKNRKPNQGDPNTLAISFLEKAPFNIFMDSVGISEQPGVQHISLDRLKNAIVALRDDSPHRDKIYSLIDEYVDLVEKRSHAQTPEEHSAVTISMRKLVSENQSLIESIPVS